MAWNTPGGKNPDPWRGKDSNNEVQAFLDKLRGMFGGGGSGGRDDGNNSGFNPLYLIIGLFVVWLMFNSFKLIDARERGVVLRFGEFNRIMEPGLNFKLPWPIERTRVVESDSVSALSDSMLVLTADENIVEIGYNVQFRIDGPQDYLFGTRDPDNLLQQLTESAVREVIGKATLEAALNRREDLVPVARDEIQQSLQRLNTGLLVVNLSLPQAKPPAPVKQAFDDVIAAEQDAQRFQEEARAYQGQVVPDARGQAARTIAEATGYRDAIIAKAEGDAERFTLLVSEYRKAPEVTRKRLYLETMQEVLRRNPRIFAGADNNTLFLPMPPAATGSSASSPMSSSSIMGLPPSVVQSAQAQRNASDRQVDRSASRDVER